MNWQLIPFFRHRTPPAPNHVCHAIGTQITLVLPRELNALAVERFFAALVAFAQKLKTYEDVPPKDAPASSPSDPTLRRQVTTTGDTSYSIPTHSGSSHSI